MDRGHPIKISFMDYDHARSELRRLNHFLLSFLYVCMLFLLPVCRRGFNAVGALNAALTRKTRAKASPGRRDRCRSSAPPDACRPHAFDSCGALHEML